MPSFFFSFQLNIARSLSLYQTRLPLSALIYESRVGTSITRQTLAGFDSASPLLASHSAV